MRKHFVLLLLLTVIITVTHAQTSSIKGNVSDSIDHKDLSNAVVSILRQSDSVLVKYTRVSKDGNFAISTLTEGNYIIMITHPYMGDYFDAIQVPAATEKKLGNIYMVPKSKLLAEVIIKSGSPIRIKGDTTIYTADSFKVRPGANVEELLRRLPGIQVDKDGKITAMGERVTKVLVDGEEFFGTDPGIATKNLRADAVKEVEVFDKKSDQAEFTGIDDGVRDKTINLKMKRKEGYFGKAELGGGLKDKFSNAIMLNSFKDKRKLAGYGIMSNTGQTNLDWDDAQNYGGGADNMTSGITEDGGMFISMSSDGDDNYWGGRNGIPTNWNGGLHYSNKFGKDDKQSFNSGYKFSKVNAPARSSTFSNIFQPDSSWKQNNISDNFRSNIKHSMNLTMDFNIDSANSLKWTTRFNKRNVANNSEYYSEALTEAGNFINNSNRNSDNTTESDNLTSSLLWRHKFKKLSRTLSISTDFSTTHNKDNGLLFSENNYYKNGIVDSTEIIDQLNVQNSNAKSLSTKIAYTEPLGKDFYMELSHSIAWNSNENERLTFEKSNNGKYEDLVDTLSNSFVFDRLVNTPGLNFRKNTREYNYSFGLAVGFSNFVQKNVTEDSRTNYNFTNFFPRAQFQYKFKPTQNLRFNYNGSTTAPSLEQLQPIRINTDPLNIYSGNPDLKQSFRHNFSIGYNSNNVLKQKYFFSNLSMNTTQHAFVQSSNIDSVGKRTYQTVNTNGIYSVNLYSSYGFNLKNKVRFGFGPRANVYRNIDFINGIKNSTTTRNLGIGLDISKYKENKFDFYFSPSFSWVNSKATVNSAANASYWQLQGWSNIRVILPKNFEISTSAETQIRQKDPRFTQNNNFTKWNASLTKRFMKENQLELKLDVFDILNQNRGYNRNFSGYSFTETFYTTLQRFWLLTFTWNISKNGKPSTGF